MISREDYLRAWGDDNIIKFPRDQWRRDFTAPPESYPGVDFIPVEMSVVYTAYLQDRKFDLYDRINLELGEGQVLTLLVIGAVPAAPDSMLFGFDVVGGRVVLLGVEDATLELVNSSFRAMTEFLYHFACLVDGDTGGDGRAQRAGELRKVLTAIDPAAFKSHQSWWSAALSEMEAVR